MFYVVLVVFSSLESYFGFRTTKGRTDHSVSPRWNKRFEHFQRGEYFSDNCVWELWVDFVSSASQFAFRRSSSGWIKPACILLLVVKITFFTCPDFLIYLHVAEPAFSEIDGQQAFSRRKEYFDPFCSSNNSQKLHFFIFIFNLIVLFSRSVRKFSFSLAVRRTTTAGY